MTLFRGISANRVLSRNAIAVIGTAAAAVLPLCIVRNEQEDEQLLSRMSPTTPIRVFRPNPSLEIAFDARTRNPVYVLERINTSNRGVRRGRNRPRFKEETRLPEVYRSRNSHYRNSGYDRGHLAPAADFPDAMEDTFSLCNVSPQDPSLNRGLWSELEGWIRRVARREWDESRSTTFVVTGPLWLPSSQTKEREFLYQYPALGLPPAVVAVPTHFFKVVVVVREERISKFGAFVIPNNTPDPERKHELERFLVRWSDLEAVVGMEFFPFLADSSWKKRADAATNPLMDSSAWSSSSPLLLPSGHQKSHKVKWTNDAIHLCASGTCR